MSVATAKKSSPKPGKKCRICRVYIPSQDELDEGYEDDYGMDVDDYHESIHFADPGGESSLRAEDVIRKWNPNGPDTIYCPNHNCHARLSQKDSYCSGCSMKVNIRNKPCGSCGAKNVLTDLDIARRYHCNACAREVEYGY